MVNGSSMKYFDAVLPGQKSEQSKIQCAKNGLEYCSKYPTFIQSYYLTFIRSDIHSLHQTLG